MGTQLPRQKGAQLPNAHVFCVQTAGCIRIPICTEVGIGPGDIVLDVGPAELPQMGHPPFSAHVYCGQTVAHLSYY